MRLLTAAENEKVSRAKKGLVEEFGWDEDDLDGMRFAEVVAAYDNAVTERDRSARMYLCSRCREGIVKNDGSGWGECPVCGQEHDIACLTELKAVR
jgi:ribosomal protein L37AE/L43A